MECLKNILSAVEDAVTIYHTAKSNATNTQSYTTFACLIDPNSNKVIALATGTQANLKTFPSDIQDCHAESLLKRSFKRMLIARIKSIFDSWNSTNTTFLSNLDLKKQLRINLKIESVSLFISQFPCGLIRRYKGQDSKFNSRKPGRGLRLPDGKLKFVEKDPCVLKIKRWLLDGLQGLELKKEFDLTIKVNQILIGKCESVNDCDYVNLIEQLKNIFNHRVYIQLVDFTKEEFIRTEDKRPSPECIICWTKTTHMDKRVITQSEIIVDGRKSGITKKDCAKQKMSSMLMITTERINQDLNELLQRSKQFIDEKRA